MTGQGRPLSVLICQARQPVLERAGSAAREARMSETQVVCVGEVMIELARVVEGLLRVKLIYFSGITLSLYSNTGLGRFLAAVELARQQGVKIAFDGNFRAHGWRGDLSRTRAVFMEALKRIDIALPAYDDEAVLWGDPSPEAAVERLQAFGIAEIVVKNVPNSALVASGGRNEFNTF